MLEIFGVTLGLMEVFATVGLIGTFVAGYVKVDSKLKNILDRNQKADEAHVALDHKVNKVEGVLRKEILENKSVIDAKIATQEERIRAQDIYSGRMEEKFNFMSGQVSRILDILEKERK